MNGFVPSESSYADFGGFDPSEESYAGVSDWLESAKAAVGEQVDRASSAYESGKAAVTGLENRGLTAKREVEDAKEKAEAAAALGMKIAIGGAVAGALGIAWLAFGRRRPNPAPRSVEDVQALHARAKAIEAKDPGFFGQLWDVTGGELVWGVRHAGRQAREVYRAPGWSGKARAMSKGTRETWDYQVGQTKKKLVLLPKIAALL